MTRSPCRPASSVDRIEYARSILTSEAAAVSLAAARLGDSFGLAVERIAGGRGRVCVTGVGKSAAVGQKIAGTLNSTGTRAYCLDPVAALHGDLGMVHPDDVALVLSHSGESEELVRVLGPLRELAAGLIGLTGNPRGALARMADVAVVYGPLEEVCPLGMAPSASTTVMLALGDALAFVLSSERNFTAEEFARYHPAGSLGRKLARVTAVMRSGDDLRIASANDTVRAVFAQGRHLGRRTGAVMLTDPDGRLCGLFTDSDLARLFEERRDAALDRPIQEVMTSNPITVANSARLADALDLLKSRKISELPVVDAEHRPVGLIDITDVIGLLPLDEAESRPAARRSA